MFYPKHTKSSDCELPRHKEKKDKKKKINVKMVAISNNDADILYCMHPQFICYVPKHYKYLGE